MVLCSFMMGLLVKLLLYEQKVFMILVCLYHSQFLSFYHRAIYMKIWHVGASSNVTWGGSLIFFACINGGLKMAFASTKHRSGKLHVGWSSQLLTGIMEACVVLRLVAQILVYLSPSFYAWCIATSGLFFF